MFSIVETVAHSTKTSVVIIFPIVIYIQVNKKECRKKKCKKKQKTFCDTDIYKSAQNTEVNKSYTVCQSTGLTLSLEDLQKGLQSKQFRKFLRNILIYDKFP